MHADGFMRHFRAGAPVLHLSKCWPLLSASMSPTEVYETFSEHRVSSAEFSCTAATTLRSAALAVQLGTRVYRHCEALPFLTAAMVFGIEDAKQHASLLPAEYFSISVPKVRCDHIGFFVFTLRL
jgi:hypothetical protein